MQAKSENIRNGQLVLVTGGSGYVAGWVIIALLQQGYTVRTTVRNLDREASVRANLALPDDADKRLSFFAADLLDDRGWDAATADVDFILHVASPMPVGEYKNTDIIRPAREGTLRVLRAGQKAHVKRVVFTSSLQAALPPIDRDNSAATDESIWTTLSKASNNYTRAKTLAEQDAWEFMRQEHSQMTLTAILPGLILGPVLGTKYSSSVGMVVQMMQGKIPRLPRFGFSIIDVRDLADLHIKAMEQPDAAGQRFVGTSDFLWMSDMAGLLREHFGSQAAKVSTKILPDFVIQIGALINSDLRFFAPSLGKQQVFSSAKAERILDWHPRSAIESLVDCTESLIRSGSI